MSWPFNLPQNSTICLYGPPKSGKNTLIHHWLNQTSQPFIWVYLNVPHVLNTDELHWSVMHAMCSGHVNLIFYVQDELPTWYMEYFQTKLPQWQKESPHRRFHLILNTSQKPSYHFNYFILTKNDTFCNPLASLIVNKALVKINQFKTEVEQLLSDLTPFSYLILDLENFKTILLDALNYKEIKELFGQNLTQGKIHIL